MFGDLLEPVRLGVAIGERLEQRELFFAGFAPTPHRRLPPDGRQRTRLPGGGRELPVANSAVEQGPPGRRARSPLDGLDLSRRRVSIVDSDRDEKRSDDEERGGFVCTRLT
jgi:hypothetical protein